MISLCLTQRYWITGAIIVTLPTVGKQNLYITADLD